MMCLVIAKIIEGVWEFRLLDIYGDTRLRRTIGFTGALVTYSWLSYGIGQGGIYRTNTGVTTRNQVNEVI
jgi:hypothetical protein